MNEVALIMISTWLAHEGEHPNTRLVGVIGLLGTGIVMLIDLARLLIDVP